eukprot:CAMPEP_0115851494 /NCGR_PEP_ID=MMETSP0287-20121206/12511_1 /TAXON_ID=412157 /ORGANISM="Chrysochromulina rotalis, Strain UIO044" /LENGTH=212 /DNA_ID=CAMNT_0003305529 /DNA_START=220 /DNA_END=861 /DNA_ORIENTATION=+
MQAGTPTAEEAHGPSRCAGLSDAAGGSHEPFLQPCLCTPSAARENHAGLPNNVALTSARSQRVAPQDPPCAAAPAARPQVDARAALALARQADSNQRAAGAEGMARQATRQQPRAAHQAAQCAATQRPRHAREVVLRRLAQLEPPLGLGQRSERMSALEGELEDAASRATASVQPAASTRSALRGCGGAEAREDAITAAGAAGAAGGLDEGS